MSKKVRQIGKKFGYSLVAAGSRLPVSRMDRYLELVTLKRLLTMLEINCVLDVGANQGQFARAIRGIGYQGHIVSFEPVSREFAALTSSFQNDPHWQGIQIALGRENGTATIHIIPQLTVMSSLLKLNDKPPGLEVEEVQVRRLDELFPSLITAVPHPRVFLKLDAEGYDLEVFRGATGCLEDICGLQSEIWVETIHEGAPHYLESLAAYEAAGFELFNLAVVSRSAGDGLQALNCLMKRP